jgi:hypothetical protein
LNTGITGVKIIHVGNRDGFSKEEIVFIDNESTDLTKKEKSEQFLEAFKKIVGNKEMIPDKSVLLISQEDHHHQKSHLKENHPSSKMKQREQSAKVSLKFPLNHKLIFSMISHQFMIQILDTWTKDYDRFLSCGKGS